MEERLFLENVSKGSAVGWGGRKRKDAERGKFSRFLPSSLLSAPPISQVPQSHCQDSWNSRCVGEGVGGTDLEAKSWPLEQGGNSPGKEQGTQDRQHTSAKGEPNWIRLRKQRMPTAGSHVERGAEQEGIRGVDKATDSK